MARARQWLYMLLRQVPLQPIFHSHHRTACPNTPSRDSGVAAIESLMDRRGAFDYILLETTGLADPGNIAPLFWVDEGLGSSIYLDGIVTLVDAKNIRMSLDEKPTASAEHGVHEGADVGPELTTAHLQISHADVVVVNKSDLVSAEELDAVTERIKGINGLAKINVTHHSRVPQLEGVLLGLHAYDDVDAGALDFASKGHSHLDSVRFYFPESTSGLTIRIFVISCNLTDGALTARRSRRSRSRCLLSRRIRFNISTRGSVLCSGNACFPSPLGTLDLVRHPH